MPHLVILYTANMEPETDMTALCRSLANAMSEQVDEAGKQVFPIGGIRVLAYPASHYAVADNGAAGRAVGGTGDYAFVYLQLRMAQGRTETVKKKIGDALLEKTQVHFEPLFSKRHLGMTFQIDEGAQVYDGKQSNLHPLFN